MTVKSVELIGEGALQKAYEELKIKLDKEGIFDLKWKKPLPLFPKKIGLITSRDGDALQDILRILHNRAFGLKIFLVPVAVQGQSAVSEITNAIQFVNSHHPVDVVIVARGGGSLEDLQAFNSEPVARAIFASKIPIVTGVGHEPDVTLVDFVADVRAATPTNAAEIVSPDFTQLNFELEQLFKHLVNAVKSSLNASQRSVDNLLHRITKALSKPKIQSDHLRDRLLAQIRLRERVLWKAKAAVVQASIRFLTARDAQLSDINQKVRIVEVSLMQLNPASILNRGYSITTKSDGKLVTSTSQIEVGDSVSVILRKGKFSAKVNQL